MRYAALAALIGMASGLAYQQFGPGADDPPSYFEARSAPHIVTLAGEWDRLSAYGFQPDWVCDADTLRTRSLQHFGEPITLAPEQTSRPNAQLAGVSYVPLSGKPGLVILGSVAEEPVLVFVDLASRSDRYRSRSEDPRNRFERRDGNLVFIEYSNLPEPVFLPAMHAR